jgi:hypothetical protein
MEDYELREKMTVFAETFPSVRNAFGIHPFDADEFNRWAQGPVSHGERVTARFLLAVWDPVIEWEAGKFDLMEALRIWDPPHREAFLAWASDPWWP